MIQKSDDILEFKNDFERFSNFYPVVIHYKRRTFPSVEHAFVSEKSNDSVFKNRIANLKESQAGKAKRLGRKIQLREDWDQVKDQVMMELLLIKFNYPEFKNLLLSTGDCLIKEGNYWHDNYWGDCTCKKCENIIGQNKLGVMIMKIRKDLTCQKF